MKSYLLVGYEPTQMDFSDHHGFNAEKVLAGIEISKKNMKEAGYPVDICFIPFGM